MVLDLSADDQLNKVGHCPVDELALTLCQNREVCLPYLWKWETPIFDIANSLWR